MAFRIFDGGGLLSAFTRCRILDAGTLRAIVRMKVMDTGPTLRTVAVFATPLSLSVSPSSTGDASFASNVLTGSCTAVPSGGLGPYSYSLAKISGATLSPSSTTTAAVTFTSPVLTADVPISSVYRFTCTDGSGQSATADVSVSFLFYTPPS